ncbi:MAG: hypothetical protein AAGA25_02395 [Planctomycetota bacterium]
MHPLDRGDELDPIRPQRHELPPDLARPSDVAVVEHDQKVVLNLVLLQDRPAVEYTLVGAALLPIFAVVVVVA